MAKFIIYRGIVRDAAVMVSYLLRNEVKSR